MTRKICNGCGGYIGIDCFNPTECEWIAQDERRIYEQQQRQIIERIKQENEELKKRLDQLEIINEQLKLKS